MCLICLLSVFKLNLESVSATIFLQVVSAIVDSNTVITSIIGGK
jgi:hypothetical protein